jgi:hypothetical protein
VAQRVSSAFLGASPKLLRPEQAGDESPNCGSINVLASVDVNFLLEGTVGSLMQPVAHYHRRNSSLVPRVSLTSMLPVWPPVAGGVPICACWAFMLLCNGLS